MTRANLGRRKKVVIFERDNWMCQLCGVSTPRQLMGMLHPHAPQIDHLLPERRGGTNEPTNLRCVCKACNHKKRSRTDLECREQEIVFVPVPEPTDLKQIENATRRQRAYHSSDHPDRVRRNFVRELQRLITKNLGGERPPRLVTLKDKIDIAEVQRRNQTGESLAAIAKSVGCSASYLLKLRRKAQGVKSNPIGRPKLSRTL